MKFNPKSTEQLLELLKTSRFINKKKDSIFENLRTKLDSNYLEVNLKKPNVNKVNPVRKLTFCEEPELGCKCPKESGHDSFCGCIFRCLKRMAKVNSKKQKPKLILLKVNNRFRIIVDTDGIYSFQTLVKKNQKMRQTIASFNKQVNFGTHNYLNDKFNDNALKSGFQDSQSTINLNICKSIQNLDNFQNINNFYTSFSPKKSPIKTFSKFYTKLIKTSNLNSKSEILESNLNHITVKNSLFALEDSPSKQPFNYRSNSHSKKITSLFEDLEFAEKDIKRTFQENSFFKKEKIQAKLKSVVNKFLLNYESIGYVQGINFIFAGILFHSSKTNEVFKVADFLFHNLEMKKIYNFSSFVYFLEVAKKLIKCHLWEFYNYLESILKMNFKLFFLDFFFCLAFNKIPITFSHLLLEGLIEYGWFFFYRFLINYFKLFIDKKAAQYSFIFQSKKKNSEFEIELKNFFKTKIDWANLLLVSMTSPLNDRIIETDLRWVCLAKFKKPLLRVR